MSDSDAEENRNPELAGTPSEPDSSPQIDDTAAILKAAAEHQIETAILEKTAMFNQQTGLVATELVILSQSPLKVSLTVL